MKPLAVAFAGYRVETAYYTFPVESHDQKLSSVTFFVLVAESVITRKKIKKRVQSQHLRVVGMGARTSLVSTFRLQLVNPAHACTLSLHTRDGHQNLSRAIRNRLYSLLHYRCYEGMARSISKALRRVSDGVRQR